MLVFKERIVAKPIVFGRYQFRTKKSATEDARRRITQQPPAKAGGLVLRTKVRIRVKDPSNPPF